MTMGDRDFRCVVFGAGALGLGFLGPELSQDCAITFVDITPKADLVRAVARGGSYTINQTGLALLPAEVDGVSAIVKEPGSVTDEALEALAAADLVFTAVGESNLTDLAPVLAAAAGVRGSRDPLHVFCCENGVDVAGKLRDAVASRAGGAAPGFVAGDTVVGRMCKIVPPGEAGARPVANGVADAVLADPCYGITVEESRAEGLSALPAAVRAVPADRFHALEDRKLLVHNAYHAVIACVGHLKDIEYVDELRADPDVMALGRRCHAGETVPALLAKHGAAIDRSDLLNYCDSVRRRVTCPVFHDPISRGVRGIMRKLAPAERLIHGLRIVGGQGIEPAAFATGVAAAITIARRTGETSMPLREVLTQHCGLDPQADADLIDLVDSRCEWGS